MPSTPQKRCKACDQLKDLTEFHFKDKARGTRQARCKSCMSQYGKQHYQENSEVYIERAKTRLEALRAENKELAAQHLLAHPCEICGEADPRCLRTSVSCDDLLNKTPEAISGLLAACTVLCLNCRAKG